MAMGTAVNKLVSFGALSNPTAWVLVLGSMPGVASLQKQQYYAHPRNSFWPIMARVVGFDATAPYDERVAALTGSGIALWDVLRSCVRPGSLDSSIEAGSRVPNDFAAFFSAHPGVKLVCFNGAEAQQSFGKLVLPHLGVPDIHYIRLPSTSPAHPVPFERKLAVWREALAPLGDHGFMPPASL